VNSSHENADVYPDDVIDEVCVVGVRASLMCTAYKTRQSSNSHTIHVNGCNTHSGLRVRKQARDLKLDRTEPAGTADRASLGSSSQNDTMKRWTRKTRSRP
jgi:hypothetical protein